MKIRYYVEYYKGRYLVKSKLGNELWGSHDTEDNALAQIIFLDSLQQPKHSVEEDAECNPADFPGMTPEELKLYEVAK